MMYSRIVPIILVMLAAFVLHVIAQPPKGIEHINKLPGAPLEIPTSSSKIQNSPNIPCYTISYAESAYYSWTIPDSYGDDYFNMRFTCMSQCTLMQLGICFDEELSAGSPGVDFIVLNSNGTYPTDTIAVYTVDTLDTWYPDYTYVDCSTDNILILDYEFHLGFTPVYNTPDDTVAVLSDDGATVSYRSSEYWNDTWGLMIHDWGLGVDFLMEVTVCNHIPDDPPYEWHDWPTLSHDYARTGYSPVEIGDLCGFRRIWQYWSPYGFCMFSNPTIADGIVYATFDVHAVALDVATGAEIWNTDSADPMYATILGDNIRTSMTIADSAVYFSAGTFEGFIKADAYTGAVIWYRGPIGGTALEGTPGAMRFCASVILDNSIFFGGDGGTIYNLNTTTGATNVFTSTPHGNGIWASMSSDGWDLYITCSQGLDGGDAGSGSTVGAVYKYTTALALYPGWPNGGFAGLLGWDEGSTCGASYSAMRNQLFTSIGLKDHACFDAYNMIIDATTGEPATDDYWLCGLGFYANHTLFDQLERSYFGNYAFADPRFDGIMCRSYDNELIWQDFTKGTMTNPAGVTYDPYLFWGTRVPPYGTFNCSDAVSGNLMFSYNITGYGFGPAIAKYDGVPYVAHTQLWSDCGTTGGRLAMYSKGEDRPRLSIPTSTYVIDQDIELDEPPGTQRTAEGVFCNSGCAPLEYCLTLDDHPDPPLRTSISTINPNRLARAAAEADRIIDVSIDDANALEGWKTARMRRGPSLEGEYGERVMGPRPADRLSSGIPPSWVTLVSSDAGVLNADDCYDATFEFDVPTMIRGTNSFYLLIVTDDPDYSECPSADPQCNGLDVNAKVRIDVTLGFSFCDGYIQFGEGGDDHEYVNNGGWLDYRGQIPDALVVDGATDPLYHATFLWMVDSNRIAWMEEGGNRYKQLFSDTSCTFEYGIQVDELCDDTPIFIDYFEAAIIDSIYDYSTGILDSSLTIGMRMIYREYGAFVPEPAGYGSEIFNNFKLIAYDLANRNDTPVDGLYWGMHADWDMPGDPAGYEQVFGDIDVSAMWQYNEVSGELAGIGVLPLAGSSFDGTTVSSGMHNGYGNVFDWYWMIPLADILYHIIEGCSAGTICYHPNAAPGSPPDDREMVIIAGHKDVAGHESIQGAYVIFCYPFGTTEEEIDDMMQFANKWAGYGRGDVNNDGDVDLRDLCYLSRYVAGQGEPPCPFLYLGDVNLDDVVNLADVQYMHNFMFSGGPLPLSKLIR